MRWRVCSRWLAFGCYLRGLRQLSRLASLVHPHIPKCLKLEWRGNLLMRTFSEIFIFVQIFNFYFPRKLSTFWMKIRESVAVLDILAVDNFDFTRKIVKQKFGWKTDFLDKNLTFWIVWWTRCHLVLSPLVRNAVLLLLTKNRENFIASRHSQHHHVVPPIHFKG